MVAIVATSVVWMPVTVAPVASAACNDWVLGPANLILHQDNGIEVDIYGWTGKSITALPSGKPAYAQYWSNNVKTTGSVSGHINGNVVEINANWGEGPGAGLSNYYRATIADDGTVFGTTTNSQNVSNGFTSETKAKCNTAPAEQPKPNPGQGAPATPAKPSVTVLQNSDVYDAKEGARVGPDTYFLLPGRKLDLVEPCSDDWCHLVIPDQEVPGGQGWVYAGIDSGQNFVKVN
ncbi:hypothetical protein CQY20_22375 [Mycolicibacterium agri]|nr:hypothetical protein CQY20_22375 [Mycolicibacterium agri]